MAIEDTYESVKSAIRERLASSLTGGFMIAWTICNWRVVVLLFGGEIPPGTRVRSVSAAIDASTHWHLGTIPLGVAIAYSVGYPWVTGTVRCLVAFAETWARNRECKIRLGRAVDPMEYERLAEDLESARRRGDNQLARAESAQTERDALRRERNDLVAKLAHTQEELQEVSRRATQDTTKLTEERESARREAAERLRVIQAVEQVTNAIGKKLNGAWPTIVTEPNLDGQIRQLAAMVANVAAAQPSQIQHVVRAIGSARTRRESDSEPPP